MLTLRPYQQAAIGAAYRSLKTDPTSRPLIVAPTGSGKSLIIAHIARDVLSRGKRCVCLVPRKELVRQNIQEFADYTGMQAGVVCAGLNRRDYNERFIVATVQSLWRHAEKLGPVACILVDECHLTKSIQVGVYRQFLSDIETLNPGVRIIGLTATPGRLDQGLLTEGTEALFTDIAYDIPLRQLIDEGYLCDMIAREPDAQIDTGKLHTRLGEFVQSELEEEAMAITLDAVAEMAELGKNRHCWMVFCSGIKHAEFTADALSRAGIPALPLTSSDPPAMREETLQLYRSGDIRAITGCEILTTGFNHRPIDLVAFLRATQSPALFVQACGRGLRTWEGKENCLLLDYGGNVRRHGPLDQITNWGKEKKGNGVAPVKKCPECKLLVPLSAQVCPDCGHQFPGRNPKLEERSTEEPLAKLREMDVNYIGCEEHVKRSGDGPSTFRVDYFPKSFSEQPKSEWLCFDHQGFPKKKAFDRWLQLGGDLPCPQSVSEALERQAELQAPEKIRLKREGKYWRVI